MAKNYEGFLTDEQVEQEIERLNASEAVALARRKARLYWKQVSQEKCLMLCIAPVTKRIK